MKIKIGDKEFEVLVAKTEEEQIKGLQGVTELSENEGILFIYDEPEDCDFWMQNCELKLDIIFINEDYEVISVKQGEPLDETFISEKDVKYVLEVNQNSGIEEGDILEMDDLSSFKINPNKMYVLDSEGKPQMELVGGERIFSRKNTKTIITIAKRAYDKKLDRDYKLLGTKIFNFMDKQDSNEVAYIEDK